MTYIIIPNLHLLSGARLFAGIIPIYAGFLQPREVFQLMLSALSGVGFLYAISHSLTLKT